MRCDQMRRSRKRARAQFDAGSFYAVGYISPCGSRIELGTEIPISPEALAYTLAYSMS